ncbi:WXG100 family type VII secretion target [Mycobacterium sp. TJFP1]
MPSIVAPAVIATLPSRSDIDGWVLAINGLSASAGDFRAAANGLESTADAHVRQMSVPGGTAWEGDAADAAHESAYADRGVIYRVADHLREMARVANSGAQDLNSLRDRALDAISEAEMDSFKVTDQLAVVDTRRYVHGEAELLAARTVRAREHQEYIAARALALASEDAKVGTSLRAGAAALAGMTPLDWSPRSAAQMVDRASRPERPPGNTDKPAQALGVKDAEDVHRIVDPLPPGRQPNVKTLPTPEAIAGLYGQLTEHSVPGPPSTYPGQWRVLEDGTRIGYRAISKFGGPTVEIWYPDGTKTDVHLAERPKGPSPAPVPLPVPAPAPAPAPVPLPAPDPTLDIPVSPDIGAPPTITPEEGGVLAVIGGIGVGIFAGILELGKLVLNP